MQKQSSIWTGVVLVGLGLWFLVRNLGVNLPGVGELWPGVLVLGGAASLGQYFSGQNRDPGQIFWGLVVLGSGVFFFLFTLHVWLPVLGRIGWDDMAWLWPAFLLIAGVAFAGQFVLGGFREPILLLPAMVLLAGGVLAFAFTLGFLSPALGRQLLKFWPLLLIVAGGGMLLLSPVRRR
ncbi:MAG: hypothetical protein D6796_00640 [Caldilineae bacterium]|nr:MAG: hypothetical protein D6796_00640 [Caldilineae bacterium]